MIPPVPSDLRISGNRYNLRGSNPDLGAADARLGTVYSTSIDLHGDVTLGGGTRQIIATSGRLELIPNHNIYGIILRKGTGSSSFGHLEVENNYFGISKNEYALPHVAIFDDGSVGIGTILPDERLDVHGNAKAEEFHSYNLNVDATNYERGFARWNTNVFEIGTEAAGTGTGRNVMLNGDNRSAYIASPTNTEIRDILISHGLMAAS